jgi:hypothetical protein
MAVAITKGTSTLLEKEWIAPNQKSWPETAKHMGIKWVPKRKQLPEECRITEKSIGITKGNLLWCTELVHIFLNFLSPHYLISSPYVTFCDHTYLFQMNICGSFSKLSYDSVPFHYLLYYSVLFHLCSTTL